MQPEGCGASLHLSTGIIITVTHIMSRLFFIFFFLLLLKHLFEFVYLAAITFVNGSDCSREQ